MIDDDVLTELFTQAGASVPAPGRAPDELLAALRDEEPAPVRRRLPAKPLLGAAAAIVVLALIAGALGGSTSGDDASTAGDAFASSTLPDVDDGSGNLYRPGDEGVPSTTTAPPASGAGGAASGGDVSAEPGSPVPPAAARVVRTGSIDIEVKAGAFEKTVERITSLAVGLGGYIAESTTAESSDRPSGSVTLRVPSDSFDELLTQVRKLGDVQSVSAKGTDVTAQFTDLAARLNALNATRDRLYEVLRGARNVGDIIAVQDRITGVQTQIEQLQGQQRLLEDQASYGTLAVTLAEPGADEIEVASEDDGIGHAWRVARRRFGDSVEGVIEWSGSAAVALLVLAALGALAWLAWTRGRRHLV